MKRSSNFQNHNGKLITYTTLQDVIDKMIGKYGMAETYQILQDIYHSKNPGLNLDFCKANIIISLSMKVFSISPRVLKEGETEKSKKARASSFLLLKKHTNLSDQTIADYFNSGLTRDKIRYARKMAENVMKQPKIDYLFNQLMYHHSEQTTKQLNNVAK